ncbi:hypothetical protein FK216_15705 [Moraxellaceae bacterium AER2_44_116]|nr:TPM domain-containing protein [Moraxellaceae bacterium]TQC94653.1 hypothetical protein FK216_15705 [Moraxellaceae bacterium AER2_44_116]
MKWGRYFNHLKIGTWQVKRAFSVELLHQIEIMINSGEALHGGELRFVVEGSLDIVDLRAEQSAHQRALDVFSLLRMWDTEERNAVLIYVLLADQAVEIIADRGVHKYVGTARWEDICRQMESYFCVLDYKSGVVVGVQAVNDLLISYYPRVGNRFNELSRACK